MRHCLFLLVIITAMFSCEDRPVNYNPDVYLTASEQNLFLSNTLAYINKPVPARQTLRGDLTTLLAKTDQQGEKIRLELFYVNENIAYFLISLPSTFAGKRYATGGKMDLGEQGEILSIEETFRTWKMAPETLQARSYFLFDKMVSGEPLSPYYTENSKGVDFIQFPDDRTYFDKGSRSWKTK